MSDHPSHHSDHPEPLDAPGVPGRHAGEPTPGAARSGLLPGILVAVCVVAIVVAGALSMNLPGPDGGVAAPTGQETAGPGTGEAAVYVGAPDAGSTAAGATTQPEATPFPGSWTTVAGASTGEPADTGSATPTAAPTTAETPTPTAAPTSGRTSAPHPEQTSTAPKRTAAAGTTSTQGRSTGTGQTSARPAIDPAWITRTASLTRIPARALQAYGQATITIAAERPGCSVGWNTLAAIGWIESQHGSYGGAVLTSDGRAAGIRGVPLNGAGVAAIPDTDGGALDGDASWDRAMGPMQFIPSTWRRWAADGNADGRADPDNLDDAALAAARYLCSGNAMGTPEGWRAAVFSYNRSADYVNRVAATANEYARRVS